MEKNNYMKLTFLNKSENEMLARAAVVSFLTYLDPTVSWINELRTAVSEAVTNCIIHAYDKPDMVELVALIDNDMVTVEVIDHGIGIEDVSKEMEMNYSTKSDEESAGMGFQIMKSFVDTLEVESTKSKGTKVIMKKKFEKNKGNIN